MKKKILAPVLVMSMILSMTACNSASTVNDTPSGESAQVSSEIDSSKASESNKESSIEASKEIAELTEDDVKAMMLSVSERMEKNPSMNMELYTVADSDISKMMVMSMAKNKDTELTYVKLGAPVMQMEVYSEKDGHLYVDMSMGADQAEAEGADSTEGVYFDGTNYHALEKAEPKEGAETSDITGSMTDSMENPAGNFDENTEFVIFNQTKYEDYTIVAIAVNDDEKGEQHMLLYVKGGVIEKIVASAATDTDTTETSATLTEAYMILSMDADAPAGVPAYFDTVEFTDADQVSMSVAFGMMGIMFSMMGTTDENGEALVPTGEWVANAGGLTMAEVDVIRELIDLDDTYL
ncbi:MAG: hypothetical protein IJ794_14930 [Lachnospiraceae bacterium]|nr:hypothetical protein [Lachnospiraceae bacterium]